MEQEKDYFVFISYSSLDNEWAIWLRHELEHYHLPASFNGQTNVRDNLRKVFRDRDELSAGPEWDEQVIEALENTNNLIVICSPNAAKSDAVNKEVETFIALGKEDHIFPFIVEGEKPADCFPRSLSHSKLGGDVNKDGGRDAAFVKVVAGMLRVGFPSLWNRYEIEKAEEERKMREQRDNLLRLQSRFLSEKANPLLKEGDYITARLIALEALPKDIESPDRPYTSEAEALLRKSSESSCAILRGHAGNVTKVIYSPDSKLIVSTSGDTTIRLWDSKTGRCMNILSGHSHTVVGVSFSPDGKLLASSSVDKTIRIWDVSTGTNILTLIGHQETVNSVAFSPDGLYLTSASDDRTVRIWDVKTGVALKVIEAHSDWVNSVSYNSDGRYVVSASKDKTVKIWESETGKCVLTIEGHKDAVTTAVFSPDNLRLYTYSWDKTARIWNSKTGESLRIFNEDAEGFYFCNAVFSPTCRYMATISEKIVVDNTTRSALHVNILKVWDVSSGMCIRDVGEIEFNSNISFSPDEHYLAIGEYNHQIRLIESVPRMNYKNLSGHRGVVNSVTFSYDGKLLLSSSFDQTVKLWDLESGLCILTIDNPKESYTSALFSPDARHFVTISTDYSKKSIIRIWETNTGKNVRILLGQPGGVFYAGYGFDGKTIISASYTSASYDTNIRYWDAETGECLKSVNDYFVNPSQISPNGKFLVSVPDNCLNGVEIWDIEKRECLHSIMDAHKDQILTMSFSPDNKYLATGSGDGTTMVWNVESGKHVKTLPNLLYAIESVAFSPDGKRIAVASNTDIAIFDFPPLQQLINESRILLRDREFTHEEKEKYYLE